MSLGIVGAVLRKKIQRAWELPDFDVSPPAPTQNIDHALWEAWLRLGRLSRWYSARDVNRRDVGQFRETELQILKFMSNQQAQGALGAHAQYCASVRYVMLRVAAGDEPHSKIFNKLCSSILHVLRNLSRDEMRRMHRNPEWCPRIEFLDSVHPLGAAPTFYPEWKRIE